MRASPLFACVLVVGCTAIEYADGGGPSAGGAGAGGGTGAAGGEPTEVCDNGVDDEPDGLTDCEDPDCENACGVPIGWMGPGTLREDGCGDEPALVHAIDSAMDESSCVCSCVGPPDCDVVLLDAFAGANCNGGGGDAELMDQCVELLDGTDSVFVTVAATCGAPQGLLLDPEPTIDSFELCADPQGTCIFQAGGHECPDAWPVARIVATNLVDTRTCAGDGCNCSPQCGTFTLFANQTCTTPVQMLEPNTCENLAGNGLAVRRDEDPSACWPGGSPTSSGELSLTDAVTICCQ